MAIEIVGFPMKNGGSFHSYVKLAEGIHYIIKCPLCHWLLSSTVIYCPLHNIHDLSVKTIHCMICYLAS